jgi:hypothetical protein
MIQFSATTPHLKKALSVVSLALTDTGDTVNTHALFEMKNGKIWLYSTDEDKRAIASLPVSDLQVEGESRFTANPKKIQSLLTGSANDVIRFEYGHETKTLKVYASEDSASFLSFASYDPDDFLTFDQEMTGASELKAINAEVFQIGIKYIQGFLPNDDKNKKFANLYIVDGVMYGSNGASKVGAFKCSDIEGVQSLILRRQMLPQVVTFIEKMAGTDIVVKETDKITMVSTPDGDYSFGFRRAIVDIPNMPIKVEVPVADGGININRGIMLKKLKRLALTNATREDMGIHIVVGTNELAMDTAVERKSYEKMACTNITPVGETPVEFTLKCESFRDILDLYQASNLDVYILKTRCIFYSEASLLIEAAGTEPIKKPFIAIGLLTQAKSV